MIRLFAAVLTLAMAALPASAAGAKTDPPKPQVERLIDKLVETNRYGHGYWGYATDRSNGTRFIPYCDDLYPERWYWRRDLTPDDAMRSLIKMGVAALPGLIDHLADARPTGVFYSYSNQNDLGLQTDEPLPSVPDTHSLRHFLRVGDLCYSIIGQIVNRDYSIVRNDRDIDFRFRGGRFRGRGNSDRSMVCVPLCKAVRDEVNAEWRGLTPQAHRDSLVRDFLRHKNNPWSADAAYARLTFYYPEELDALIVPALRLPAYSAEVVAIFAAEQLHRARPAAERRAAAEEFFKKHGEMSRVGLRRQLFQDLAEQERNETGGADVTRNRVVFARESLIDVFGLPETVTSEDAAPEEPTTWQEMMRLVGMLTFDDRPAIDRAVAELLARAGEQEGIALACFRRLAGRGYDDALETHLKKHPPKPNADKDYDGLEAMLGWTRLHAAAREDWLWMVDDALRRGADIDARTRDGRTALQIAVKFRSPVTAKALLGRGAKADTGDPKKILEWAGKSDSSLMVRLLAWNGAKPRDPFSALLAGDDEALAEILKADPKAAKLRNHQLLVPLHVAARDGNANAVRMLLKAGANVSESNEVEGQQENRNNWRRERTPLHYAAYAGHPAVVELLLAAGADPNLLGQKGVTALHLAASHGNVAIVKMLLAAKADPKRRDEDNFTPLRYAARECHDELYELLPE